MFKKQLHIQFIVGVAAFGVVAMPLTSGRVFAQDGTVSAIGSPVTPTPAPPVDPVLPQPGQPVVAMPNETNAPVEISPEVSDAPANEEPVSPVMPEVTEAPSEPSEAELSPTNSMTSLPDASDGNVVGTNVMGDGGVKQKHSGTYYDSDALVPDSDLANAGAIGPRKVDPALEPGQKFIVVEKSASASSYEAQYVGATRALKLGRYAAAMEMFENLYKKNHKDPRILMGLAVAQQGAGFNESASRTYEELLSVQPNNANAIVNLMGLMRQQYPSVTLRKLTELRSKYPTNPGIPAQIGLVNAEMKNYAEAVRYLEIAASMDPRNSSHIYNMAIVTDRSGKPSQAIKLYERALQLDATYGDSANALPREEIYDRLVVLRRKV